MLEIQQVAFEQYPLKYPGCFAGIIIWSLGQKLGRTGPLCLIALNSRTPGTYYYRVRATKAGANSNLWRDANRTWVVF